MTIKGYKFDDDEDNKVDGVFIPECMPLYRPLPRWFIRDCAIMHAEYDAIVSRQLAEMHKQYEAEQAAKGE